MNEMKLPWSERGKLWGRLGIRLALAVLALALLWAVGLPLLSLFAPFVAALITAAILHPLVRWLQRRLGVPRKLSVLVILVLLFGLLGAGIGYLGYAAGLELVALVQNWSALLENLQGTLDQLEGVSAQFWDLVPPQLTASVESMTQSVMNWLSQAVPNQISTLAEYTIETAKGVPDFVVGLIIYIMACYMLTVDYSYLRGQAAQHTHQRLRRFLKQVRDTALTAFGGYLRAEFLLSVVVFFILLVGFFVIGQSYGLLLALGLAVMDFIPIIGAGTVMVPWALIDLFTGNYVRAVELMLIWGVIALFRRVGEPKFVGDQTGLSPITSLISIYIGWRVAGVLGMILGPTIALIALNLVKLGLFEGIRLDLVAAAGDIMAVLRERPPKIEE